MGEQFNRSLDAGFTSERRRYVERTAAALAAAASLARSWSKLCWNAASCSCFSMREYCSPGDAASAAAAPFAAACRTATKTSRIGMLAKVWHGATENGP